MPFILAASNAPWRAKKNSDTRTGRASVTRSAESVRGFATEVVAGRARPEGFCAVVHHGLLRAVTLLLSSQASADATLPCPAAPTHFIQYREFLHLVANMVLQAHSEVSHVY